MISEHRVLLRHTRSGPAKLTVARKAIAHNCNRLSWAELSLTLT